MRGIEGSFRLSGFGDEIAPDLETQLDVLGEVGIGRLDLRSVEGTNVLELSDTRVREIAGQLANAGVSVPVIGSPIGKVEVDTEFASELAKMRRALAVAAAVDANAIRVFSYYLPEADSRDDWHDEVLRRLRQLTELAAEAEVTLLLENEQGLYGATPGRCRALLTQIDSPYCRAVFDPANFVEIGVSPYPDALIQLVEFVDYLHIKDAEYAEDRSIVLPGDGDANIPEILTALARRGFTGGLALEPHLEVAGPRGGFSGPAGFKRAANALKEIIAEIDRASTEVS